MKPTAEPLCRVYPIDAEFVRQSLPKRRPDGHKGTFGKVLVIGGAEGYTGAPYLAAAAAVRSGCGLVSLGVPESIWAILAVKCTSAMPFPLPGKLGQNCLGKKALGPILEKLSLCDVLALGPGLGRSQETVWLVRELLKQTEKPVVLDADGINALEGHIDILSVRRGHATILTPHDIEFARLTGEQPPPEGEERIQTARAFAKTHGCTLILKGHRTLTATAAGTVLVNTTGNSGLAKGGSGDVLTGVVASLLAQGASPVMASACGVWLHGKAGDLAAARLTAYGMMPMDVVDALPEAFWALLEDGVEC